MDQGEPNAKRQRPNDEAVAAVAVDAPDAIANEQQIGDIFKLDIDCFEETFDFLPFKDLVSVGKTCKRLQQVAGYCFQQNYSGKAVFCNSKGFETDRHPRYAVNHFAPFIQTILIGRLGFQWFLNVQSKCRQLKQIELLGIKISKTDVNRLKENLRKLEVLHLYFCQLNENNIIDQCKKIKSLKIDYCEGEYEWLNRKYPTMEYFKFVPRKSKPIDGLPMFLERNPNIRAFATTAWYLLKNQDAMMTANIKLDELAIEINSVEVDEIVSIGRLLNELHERGFKKRLKLYFDTSTQETIDQLAKVNGLVKLHVNNIFGSNYPIALSALKSLEEISAYESAVIRDLGLMANELTNLKRIHFEVASIDDIMPFIRRSLELRKIRIDFIQDGMHFSRDTQIIDLLALNKKREQSPNAGKITLYVKEEIYLATKRAMKETDLGLIRLKRRESFEWDHDFTNEF